MPVMGPNYSDKLANEAYEKVFALLQKEYHILTIPETFHSVMLKDREERKDNLRTSIHKLFELDSWEGF